TLSRPSGGGAPRARGRRCCPWLEVLEDRSLLSATSPTLTWINPAGGDWFNPANWDDHRVPTRKDDAVIDMNNVVVPLGGRTAVANSLDCAGTLKLITFGKLELLNDSSIQGLQLAGGTLYAYQGLDLTGAVVWTGGKLGAAGSISLDGTTRITSTSGK